jgi:hypothetical protein
MVEAVGDKAKTRSIKGVEYFDCSLFLAVMLRLEIALVEPGVVVNVVAGGIGWDGDDCLAVKHCCCLTNN